MEWTSLSYDLFFVSTARPAPAEFAAHFGGRKHYQLDRGQAWYQNSDTGVFFCFELVSPEDSEDLDFQGPDSWSSFSLGLYRPHFFAEEAVAELEAFVTRFNSRAFDPQSEGVGEGRFSAEGFLRGYRDGNRAAYCAMASIEGAAPPITRPSAELERIWRWNRGLDRIEGPAGEKIPSAPIGFYRRAERVISASVWKDGARTILPRTDAVIVERDELAPRRLWRRVPGLALVEWHELEPLLARYPSAEAPYPHARLDYPTRPAALTAFIKALPSAAAPERIPMDCVLNAELFEASRP